MRARPLDALAPLALAALAACGGPRQPAAVAGPDPVPMGFGPATAPVATATADTVRAELVAFAQARQQALAPPAPSAPPPSPSDGEEEPDLTVTELAAVGPCQRPDAAARAALVRDLTAWIARTERGARPLDDVAPTFRLGCVEPSGIIVDVQADLGRGRTRFGRWWTVRYQGGKVEVLATAGGCAVVDCMEWSDVGALWTVGLVDLDRDGHLDLVLAEDHHEGGAAAEVDVRIRVGARTSEIGHVRGDVALAEAADEPGVAVLALQEDGPVLYRCVTDHPGWTACRGQSALEHTARARAAADELATSAGDLLADRAHLAQLLHALDAEPAERDRWLAAARPSTLAMVLTRYQASRDPSELLGSEREANGARARAALADTLRTAVGQPRCPTPSTADERAARAALGRWLATHARGAVDVSLAGCVVARAGLWTASWHAPAGDGWEGTSALVAVRDGKATPLVTTHFQVEADGGERYPTGEGFRVAAKLFVEDGAVGALVSDGDRTLVAVRDGVVTGRRELAHTMAWNQLDGDPVEPTDDTLAESTDDLGVHTFWRATATGVEAVATLPAEPDAPPPADPLPRLLHERVRQREAWALVLGAPPAEPVAPALRARYLAALALIGAPAVVQDAARAAP